MKKLSNYIVEKLNVKNISTKQNRNKISVEIPKFPAGEDNNWDGSWNELEVPDAKYFVYKDNYHGLPHVASFFDMVKMISMFNDEYEDFTPDKIILYSSNDEVDVVKWALKNILKMDDKDINIQDEDEWVTNFDNKRKHPGDKIYDSAYFLYNILQGNDHIDPYSSKKLDNEKEDGYVNAQTIMDNLY